MEADFSGYATKAGLKCSDGRTIKVGAFEHQDKMTVPLVWQHMHDEPTNVLGHAVLENRGADHPEGPGTYAYGFFNDTVHGQHAKTLVQHKDVSFLSIYANQLIEKAKEVFHGTIREVSLVLAGANPGAKIDTVAVQHSDGEVDVHDDEAFITTGLEIKHADASDDQSDTLDFEKVYATMSDDQKELLHFMVGTAVEEAKGDTAEHSDDNKTEGDDNKTDDNKSDDDKSDDKSDKDDLSHKEGTTDVTNVFETKGDALGKDGQAHSLSHDAMRGIFADAAKRGSLKEAVEAYAEANLQHGINDIDLLFPEARLVDAEPEWIKRRTEWVATVLNGVRKSPFSRIKTRSADIRQDDARAKGYITGNYKKEEWFGVSQRVTTPTTIYKKQRLDRDDIIDITDFDVVVWMKGEMRLMWEEELARAILVGDGRDVSDEDKVRDPMGAAEGAGIRSIANDHEFYVTTVNTQVADTPGASWEVLVDDVTLARQFYRGSSPIMFTTQYVLSRLMLSRDGFGRKVFSSESDLATQLGVSRVVPVEIMEDQGDLLAIIVNLNDYSLGADRGGELSYFDDFDLDYNQYKYLYEGRCSGALTKYKTAIVVRNADATGDSALIVPTSPTFNATTGVVTIPTVTGVTYKNSDTDATLSAGAQSALAAGATLGVYAVTDSTHHFATGEDDQWEFTRPSA